jgi:hypothetical protein
METFSSLVDKLLVHPSLCDYIVQFNNISELFSSRFMNLYWLCNILEGAYVRYSGEEAEPFEYSRDNWRENLPRLIKLVHLCELNEIKSDETLTCMLETADSPTAILYFCDLLSGILDIVDDRVVTMFPPKPHRVGASGAMNFFTSSSAQRTSTRPLEQLNIASSPRQKGMSNTSTSARVALVPFGSPKPSAHPIFSPGAMVYNTAINLIQTFIPTAGTTARSEPDSDEKNQEMVSFEERELQFEREKRSVMVVASSQSLAAAEAREDLLRVISELDVQKKANADLQVKISSLEAALSLTDKANDVIQTNEIVARDSINIDQENAVKALESEKATTLSLQATLEDFQKKLTAREEELQKVIFLEKQRADIAIRSTGVKLVSVKSDLSSLRSLVSNQVTMATKGLAELSSSLAFRLADAERGVTEAKSRYLSEQIERRKVLNALQEAKGSIRVLARVRPLLTHERAFDGVNDPSNVIRASSSFELIVPEAEAINARARFQESKSFEFERVFSAGSTQADVFAEVQPLVQSALDGYHACIFAYGQTGSGKTHTMEGGDTDETRGVYYRSLNELFNERDRRSVEWEFTMRLSIVEIYNETVVDLLADAPSSVSDDVSMDGEGSRAFVEIKQGPQGVHLPDAVVVEVSSQEAVEALMKRGSSNRSVGRTNANEHSSRSHSLLILDIHGSSRLGTGEQTYGRLVLVDLAGSERLSKSGAEGMRLKEAQAINSSLSALGDVISAMAKKASHIPFRNSKLTYLLQDSLGKGRTMMIANLSPTPASRGETLCTLTFASRVRKVEVGKAIKHADSGELKRAKEAAAKAAEEADAVAEKAAVMSEKVNELTSKLTTVESELATLKKSLLVTSNSTTTSSTQMSTVAAGSSADVIAAAVKRATEDVTAKMKLAQAEAVRRAAFDAEATAKAEAEKSKLGLQRQLRELQTALERADVKSKDAIAAAVQAARVSWERERERDRARTTRSGKVTEKGGPPSRKQSLSGTWLASTIAAAGINSTGSASSSHEAGKTTSSTTALISAATASMVDERAITIPSAAALFMEREDEYVDRIIADDDLGNEDTLNDVAENLDDIAIPDGGHVAGPSVSIAEADVSAVNISVTSTTINDSTLIAEEDLNEKSVVVTNPLAPFCEDGNQRLMVVSPLPSTSLSGQKTQTPVSSDAISLSITLVASAQDSVGCSSTLSSSPPSLPLQPAQTKSLTPFKATLSSRAPTPDENEEDEPVEANIANASDVLTSAVPSTLQESTEVNGEVSATGKFTFGSRERARLAGLPSPKPESGILKQGAAGGKRRRSNPDNSTTALSDQAVSGATSVIAIGRPTRGKKTVALLSPDMSSAVRITAPQILDDILPTSIPQSAAPISATVTSHVSTKKPTSLSRSSSGSSLHQSSQSISQTNRSSTPAASRKPSLQITQPPTTTTTVGPALSLLVAAPSTVVAPLHAASPRAPLQPRPANVVSSTASLAGAKRSAPGPAPSDIDALKKPRKEGGASSSSTSSGPSRVKVDAQSSKPAQKGATRVVVNALGQVARRA